MPQKARTKIKVKVDPKMVKRYLTVEEALSLLSIHRFN